MEFQAELPDDFLAKPHKLCGKCQNICSQSGILPDVPAKWLGQESIANGHGDEEFREHFPHATYSELVQTCKEGCHLCTQIYHNLGSDQLKRLAHREEFDELEGQGRLEIVVAADEFSGRCRLDLQIGQSSGGSIPVIAYNDPRLPPPETAFDAQVVVSTSSNASIELVKYWLRDCDQNHPACASKMQENSDDRINPTRLICVGSEAFSKPRLYYPKPREELSYLTLSHSWGNQDIFRLTSQTLRELNDGISEDRFPKTFRNAMTITRNLGYEYIWIDSVCIIQDSKEDWEGDAPRMASVYGNSALTIAALGPSSHHGCFVRRNPLTRRPCRLVGGENDGVYAQGFQPAGQFGTSQYVLEDSFSSYDGGFDATPLLTRAWVLQERLLSPRVIYFAGEGLFWECRISKLNEFWPWGRPHAIKSSDNTPVKVLLESNLRPSPHWSKDDGQRFAETWDMVLDNYNRMNLTFNSDRPVALSGIATYVAKKTSLTYLIGHWKELIPQDLLWSRSGPLADPQTRRAPSWSWLSIDGAIPQASHIAPGAENVNMIYTAECLDLLIEPVKGSMHVFGDVSSAMAILKGWMLKLYQPEYTTVEAQVRSLWVREKFTTGDELYNFTHDEDVASDTEIFFFVVRMASYRTPLLPAIPGSSAFVDEVQELGLAITPQAGGEPDLFRRIGYVSHLIPNDEHELETRRQAGAEERTIKLC